MITFDRYDSDIQSILYAIDVLEMRLQQMTSDMAAMRAAINELTPKDKP